jgi:hypothetical protein
MAQHMGQDEADGEILDALPWVLLGGAAGVAAYFLLKPKQNEAESRPGTTQAAPVAPIAPPSRFADLTSVSKRFDQVRELYRMGYLTPERAFQELEALAAAANTTGQADPEAARILVAKIEEFMEGIRKTPSPALTGIRFPFLNLRRPR